ncbi:fibrinogen-like protein 1 [Chiloscyllium punctatum]|uniref:fibrinogen-like protein 1 n=1 Tax=Chiloscyllium punctatum TaxID=137246 RepID=UPI003B639887
MWSSRVLIETCVWALIVNAWLWITGGIAQNGSEELSQEGTVLPLGSQYRTHLQLSRRCRHVANSPQLEGQRCPIMLGCWEHTSRSRLQDNENGRQQIVGVKEMMSQIQEELKKHQHQIKVLDLQLQEKGQKDVKLETEVQHMKQRSSESSTLLHIHASLIYDLQTQVHNLLTWLDQAHSNSNCSLHHHLHQHHHLPKQHKHSDLQYIRNCPLDCASIYYNGVTQSGIYTIIPSIGGLPTRVYCDMDTAGGGWTIIQRRVDGTIDFNRGWTEYKEGFGELTGEFWLGNNHIHDITSQGEYSLRIDLEDWKYRQKFVLYETFRIEDESNHFRLHVAGFSGTLEDSFAWYHNKRSFSTPDTGNICAKISHGGWWYHQCFFSNLNGIYYKGGKYSAKDKELLGPDGIVWYSWKNSDYYSLKSVSMKIRPRNFRPQQTP